MAAPQQMVFIVDDDPRIRDAVHTLLASAGLLTRRFASASPFMETFDPDASGCILLDVRLPGISGLDLLRWLKEKRTSIPVLMLSAHADVAMAVRAMKDGAADFIEKPFNGRVLLETVQRYLAQSEDASQVELAGLRARLKQLTGRESIILERVMEGQPSKVIAAELGLSPRTIDVHRSNIMKKLGVRNAPALVRLSLFARSRGLMD